MPINRKAHELEGKSFGALRIYGLWGSMKAGRAWIYWCRVCGYVNRRLGTKLLNQGDIGCPDCGARSARGRVRFPRILEEELVRFLEECPRPRDAPPILRRNRRAWTEDERERSRLAGMSRERLVKLRGMISQELMLRSRDNV